MKKILSSNRILLALLLACTFLIYQPGLYGDYIFDDLSNITANSALEIKVLSWQAIRDAAISSFSGPLKRPISMLTFAFNASTTGFGAPLFFKLTGLFVHLASGLAVFWLAGLLLSRFRLLTNAPTVPSGPDWTRLLITGIWLLHPLNLSGVLYIVQRMTTLSALFAFLAVALYCKARQRIERSQSYGWILIGVVFFVFLPLSALSKENGVLIPVLLLVVELTAFDYKSLQRADRIRLGLLGLFALIVPALLVIAAILMKESRLMGGYEMRDFNMYERILTQGRVLWHYIGMVILPTNASLGLYHDDVATSKGILSPMTTLLSWGGIIGLWMIALFTKRRNPALTFGVFWFFGGHLLESTVLPLEMVHEHRNYLPNFGLIFAACFFIAERNLIVYWRRLIIFSLAAYMFLLAGVTFLRAEQWGNSISHAVYEAENHPNSERAQLQLGRMFMIMMIDNPRIEYYAAAKEALEKSIRLSKISVTAHFSLIQLAFLTKQPVDPAVVGAAENVLSTGPVPPSVAPAFRALIDCQIFTYCKLTDADVTRLADSALTNPRATIGVKTQIAIYLTQYQIDKMGNGDLAVFTLQNALKRDPTAAALHLSAARVFRVLGDVERSGKHLEDATRFDTLATYRTAITDEQQKLKRDVEKSRELRR